VSRPRRTGSTAPNRAFRASGFQGRIADADLRLLRVFHTVAEHGGFSAAEVVLGKSKSAISIDIAALEDRLNMTLCQRGRSGFSLTREGQSVLDATRKLFQDIETFQDHLAQVSGRLTGRLSLYVVDNIIIHGDTRLLRALALFATRHPDVQFDVRSTSAQEVEFAVLNGTATVGISLEPRLRASMDAVPLFEERSNLYCGARHPLFSEPEDSITAERLAESRMVEVAETATSPSWEALRVRLNFRARAEHVDARALLILSGVYIGFLPERLAGPLVAEGQLRHIDFGGLHLTNQFHLLLRPAQENGLLAATFRAILDETP